VPRMMASYSSSILLCMLCVCVYLCMFFVYVYVFNEEFFSTYTTKSCKSREVKREKESFYSLFYFSQPIE